MKGDDSRMENVERAFRVGVVLCRVAEAQCQIRTQEIIQIGAQLKHIDIPLRKLSFLLTLLTVKDVGRVCQDVGRQIRAKTF